MTCFSWMLSFAVAVVVMVSLIRWFEQVTEAVELRWWNKVFVLIAAPFTVWFFPSRIAAGRPTAVPHHEPVRGFGKVSLTPGEPTRPPGATSAGSDTSAGSASANEGPPPGTPKEFIGLPKIPPKKKSAKPPVDPEQIAKLKQKMREQGMLDDEE